MNNDKNKKTPKPDSSVKIEINKPKESGESTKTSDKPKHDSSKSKKGCC